LIYRVFKINNLLIRKFENVTDIRTQNNPWDWEIFKKNIKNIGFYSPELLNEVERRFTVVTKYLTGNSVKKLAKTHKLSEFSIKKLGKELLWDNYDILRDYIPYVGTLGLEKAIVHLKVCHSKHHRLPRITDKESGTIAAALKRREWTSLGIKTWTDLLRYVFGETNRERNKYRGIFGLQQAKTDLKEFFTKYDRFPIGKDTVFSGIFCTLRRKEWVPYGIQTWNDLLFEVFGEVNSFRGKYMGKKGLQRAKVEFQSYFKKTHQKPTKTCGKFHGIITAINRKEWVPFGIVTWNDLLMEVFGEVNIELFRYIGELGLQQAKHDLETIHGKYGRLPITTDPEVSGILKALQRNEWKSLGIQAWNELLIETFGEINTERNKYYGLEGLNCAKTKLKSFYKKYHRLPTANERGIRTIYKTARRGIWIPYGIQTWNDLLLDIFGRINLQRNEYCGKEGLQKARTKLINFFQRNNRIPNANEKGIRTIYKTVRRGVWSPYDIKSWKSLLQDIFGEVRR
jgi:hypothetical protein